MVNLKKPFTGYNREVTGSNPIEVLTFAGFYTQLIKIIAFITAMIIAYLLCVILFHVDVICQRFIVCLQFTRSINKHNLNVTSVPVKYTRLVFCPVAIFRGNSFGLDVRLPLQIMYAILHLHF